MADHTQQKTIRKTTAGRTAATAREAEKRANYKPPAPPGYLTDKAAAIWEEVFDAVAPDHFEQSDWRTLAAYCEAAALVERMSDDVEDAEFTVTDARGNEKPNPLLVLFKGAVSTVNNCAMRLRLTPAGRRKESAAEAGAKRAANAGQRSTRRAGLMFDRQAQK